MVSRASSSRFLGTGHLLLTRAALSIPYQQDLSGLSFYCQHWQVRLAGYFTSLNWPLIFFTFLREIHWWPKFISFFHHYFKLSYCSLFSFLDLKSI